MFIKVKAVAKEIKTGQKGFFRGVKREQGWLNVWSKDEESLKAIRTGGTIDVTEPETYDTGRGQAWSCWLSVKQEQPQPKAEEPKPQPVQETPRKMGFWAYVDTMRTAHDVAKELEPDEGRARAALVNTIMMAVTRGEVEQWRPSEDSTEELTKEPNRNGEDVPPPLDDDLPPWAG